MPLILPCNVPVNVPAKFPTKESAYIFLNDFVSEPISNIPVEEHKLGLQKAIDEFLEINKEWKLKISYTNNNGLTILQRLSS